MNVHIEYAGEGSGLVWLASHLPWPPFSNRSRNWIQFLFCFVFEKVSYSVQPVIGSSSMFRWKRQESGSQLKARRGTNMRFLPLDWPSSDLINDDDSSSNNKKSHGDHQQQSATLASTLLLAAGLLVILVMAVLIVFSVYYRPSTSSNKKKKKKKNINIISSSNNSDNKNQSQSSGANNINSTSSTDGISNETGGGINAEAEHEDEDESTPMKALNNNGRMMTASSTSGSIKITLVWNHAHHDIIYITCIHFKTKKWHNNPPLFSFNEIDNKRHSKHFFVFPVCFKFQFANFIHQVSPTWQTPMQNCTI